MEIRNLSTHLVENPKLTLRRSLTEAFSASLLLVLVACVENTDSIDTSDTDEDFVYYCDNSETRSDYSFEQMNDFVESVPVCIHVVYATKEDKQNAWGDDVRSYYESTVIDAVNTELLNEAGLDTLIRLEKDREVNAIVSREWANLMNNDDTRNQIAREMQEANNFSGCVNIYFVNYFLNDGDYDGYGVAAFATYPEEDNGGVVSMVTAPDTLSHELGHTFGLLHTFEREWAQEGLTDPEDCYNNGDLLCDTSPDPGLIGIEDADGRDIGCQTYFNEIGGETNQWSTCTPPYEEYGPDIPKRNQMSYYHTFDWREFTPEQGERMRCALDQYSI